MGLAGRMQCRQRICDVCGHEQRTRLRQEDTTAQQRTVGLSLNVNDRVVNEPEDIEHRRQAGMPSCFNGFKRPLNRGRLLATRDARHCDAMIGDLINSKLALHATKSRQGCNRAVASGNGFSHDRVPVGRLGASTTAVYHDQRATLVTFTER